MSAKRANLFDQGRPEQPYNERDEEDPPKRATAAQLAARKIKIGKSRRPAGAPSTPSQSANFGASLGGINFGSTAPASTNNNNTNGMGFGGNNAFGGGGATNSFPPAQSSAPSNAFANSSFPAFGAGNQSTGFNPQPPATSFNFTAGASNPFSSSSPMTNGNGPTFGGFGGQQSSNPFGGLSQNNTSAASTGSMFGTSSGAPSSNMFGATNSTPNASGTPAQAPAPFSFGATSSAPQNPPSTPAASNIFSGFGTTTQNNVTPAPSNMFGGFCSNAQNNAQDTPKPSLFNMGTSSQNQGGATATASTPSLFNFGASAQNNKNATSTAPSTNFFNTSSTPASAPASNPFASLPAATTASTPFNFGQQTPKAQEIAPTASSNPFAAIKLPEDIASAPKPNLFSSIQKPEQSSGTASETPKSNLFASLAKTPQPAASSPGLSLFGATQSNNLFSVSNKEAATDVSKAPEADRSSLFRGFNTPQPAKTAEADTPQTNLLNAAQPKTSSGLFSQSFQPETSNSGNAFLAPSSLSGFKTQSVEAAKDATAQSFASKEAAKPFAKPSSPQAERSNLFSSPKEPTVGSPSAAMPALTGGATSSVQAAGGSELPKIPKAHVPKEWAASNGLSAEDMDDHVNIVLDLTTQLQQLNDKYRSKLNLLSPLADWSSLSQWHYQHSSALKKKIDQAKKQRATANGITGNESTLSTKRKVNEESPEERNASPSKRARPAEVPTTPTPQPSTHTPRFEPPATATSNIFAKAINNKPSTTAISSNLFAPKSSEPRGPEPTKPAAPTVGFTPSFAASNGASTSQNMFSPNAVKPSTSIASASGSAGFKPTASTSTGGGFLGQFASKAKTYEQLAAERKQKVKDDDYDSDEESEEQWSARYDQQEAERLAKEKADAATASGFSLPASGKISGNTTPAGNLFSSLAKPASGASTPSNANGLYTPRPASPALSSGSQSVFGAPPIAQGASPNIFGHLSSGNSSNHHEDSDDDGDQAAETSQNDQQEAQPKRKFGVSDSEADDSQEEAPKHKKQDIAPKGSLLSRMTRNDDDSAESEKENNAGSTFGKANGTQTPKNKHFFDFGAAGAKTAPPKSDTFTGDQTFKAGTPIKFGAAPSTEQKPPTFQFQPATASTTPSKPPPASIFNFGAPSGGSSLLAPNTNLSGLGSAPSSVFSSRAATPLSEAETSAASAAEEDDEGGKQEQVDFSKLTKDELAANDVIFETEQALAKHQVDDGNGNKNWEAFARGPLYILQDKVTGKCIVRIRLTNGQMPLNYHILPALTASPTGSTKKMVNVTMPKKEGGIAPVFINFKTREIAQEFADRYNESLPS